EAYWLLRHAFTRPVPTLFLEDRSLNGAVGSLGPNPEAPARARTLRAGRDAVVIAAGRMAVLAQQAAEAIASSDKPADIRVLSLGAVKPLDRETILDAARATGRVLIVQEEPPLGGYGPAIQSALDALPLTALKRQPVLLARPDTFLPYNREEDVLPSAEKITATLRNLLA